jgi:hypothetical protein
MEMSRTAKASINASLRMANSMLMGVERVTEKVPTFAPFFLASGVGAKGWGVAKPDA